MARLRENMRNSSCLFDMRLILCRWLKNEQHSREMLPACSQEYLQREFVTNNTHSNHNMLWQERVVWSGYEHWNYQWFPSFGNPKKNQFWPKAQYHVKDFDNNLEHNLIVESVYNLECSPVWPGPVVQCWTASYLTHNKYYDTLGLKSQDKCSYLYKLL